MSTTDRTSENEKPEGGVVRGYYQPAPAPVSNLRLVGKRVQIPAAIEAGIERILTDRILRIQSDPDYAKKPEHARIVEFLVSKVDAALENFRAGIRSNAVDELRYEYESPHLSADERARIGDWIRSLGVDPDKPPLGPYQLAEAQV